MAALSSGSNFKLFVLCVHNWYKWDAIYVYNIYLRTGSAYTCVSPFVSYLRRNLFQLPCKPNSNVSALSNLSNFLLVILNFSLRKEKKYDQKGHGVSVLMKVSQIP